MEGIGLSNPVVPTDLAGDLLVLSRKSESEASAEQAAKDFESVLINKLLDEMRKTIPDSGLFDSAASEQMEGIFWFYLAQEVANKGGLGLWKELAAKISGADAVVGGDADAGKLELLR